MQACITRTKRALRKISSLCDPSWRIRREIPLAVSRHYTHYLTLAQSIDFRIPVLKSKRKTLYIHIWQVALTVRQCLQIIYHTQWEDLKRSGLKITVFVTNRQWTYISQWLFSLSKVMFAPVMLHQIHRKFQRAPKLSTHPLTNENVGEAGQNALSQLLFAVQVTSDAHCAFHYIYICYVQDTIWEISNYKPCSNVCI